MARFARWQLASRLMPNAIEFPFVETTSLFATRGTTGATGNWYCGLHEFNEMAFLLHALRPTDHFCDVGANIGSYSVLSAGVVGAQTTAIEPLPSTFENLKRNLKLNGLNKRVHSWQGGLSNQSNTLMFTNDLDTANHVLANDENRTCTEVPVTTMDKLLWESPPAIIKIDVEGHELSVLKGAPRTLSNPHLLAVIMETNGSGKRYGLSDEGLYEVMSRYGFDSFTYCPFTRQIIKNESHSEGNTIFIRDTEVINERIKSAPRFKLVNGII